MSFRRIPGMRRGGALGGFRGGMGSSPWRLERGMLALMVVSAVVFVLSAVVPGLHDHLVLVPRRALRGLALWQPLTALFTNLTFGRFVLDLVFLWLMGSFVERAIGRRDAVVLYLTSGVVAYFATAAAGLWL